MQLRSFRLAEKSNIKNVNNNTEYLTTDFAQAYLTHCINTVAMCYPSYLVLEYSASTLASTRLGLEYVTF